MLFEARVRSKQTLVCQVPDGLPGERRVL
jgi:hypothetical protein